MPKTLMDDFSRKYEIKRKTFCFEELNKNTHDTKKVKRSFTTPCSKPDLLSPFSYRVIHRLLFPVFSLSRSEQNVVHPSKEVK